MRSYRKICKRRMTVALVLLAVAAVILGVLFIFDMGFGYTEAWWVFFYITLSLVCLCSYIGFGFAIAGLCAAVRAKKADEPKAKGLTCSVLPRSF